MNETTELLNDYTKQKHIDILYSNITRINFNIKPITSENWINETNIPYIATSYLLDSYSCLHDRPDMAFTFLWKSINNCYKTLGINKILNSTDPNIRLSDALGIDYLIDEINNKKNDVVSVNYNIISLINEYAKVIPLKPFKFLSNQILKGYVMEEAGIPNLLIGSTYSSFKKSYPDIYQKIVNTYGQSYKAISNPTVIDQKVNLGITDLKKSKSIPKSLAEKLKDLFENRTTTVQNSGGANSYTLSITDDKIMIRLLIKTLLYSIRNNSVHGNLVSRLNSDYVNNESLKTAINIYFLGHMFLSLALYVNNEIAIADLKTNEENLNILKQINNCT
ncbi:hypothetical protein [Flavobacterium aquicola]|uniref:Uncharacterized protein n=1 Tax=Flavobacterium aquicola TaxID=1682742 RepID=A0A3E0DVA3_9FLAO|nr:hypothetical protein [Flavobacterium aquicola]REG88564.1 hypothetical protein C8P67_1321 [Flavobacterium aquicola]